MGRRTFTEEEARKLNCPCETGFYVHSNGGPFPVELQSCKAYCIGSQCMAWQWQSVPSSEEVKAHRELSGCSLYEAVEYVKTYGARTDRGYCGKVMN